MCPPEEDKRDTKGVQKGGVKNSGSGKNVTQKPGGSKGSIKGSNKKK